MTILEKDPSSAENKELTRRARVRRNRTQFLTTILYHYEGKCQENILYIFSGVENAELTAAAS
jgi:hypothetical protein